ncbi:hypothetical protein Tco_0231183 [Tanacetum coccineum]
MMASVTIRSTEVAALETKKVVQKYSHTIESCICYCLATTHGQHVLSFYPEDRSCNVFEDAMSRCRENGTQLMLAGQSGAGKTAYDVSLIDDGWTPEIFNVILDNTSSSWERLDVCALSHTFELESIVKTEFHSKPAVVTFHVPTKVALQVGLENDPSWYCRHCMYFVLHQIWILLVVHDHDIVAEPMTTDTTSHSTDQCRQPS